MHYAVGMMQLLGRAADEKGKAVVVVLHDINFASCYADHIVAMHAGKLAYQGSPQQIIRGEVLGDSYKILMQVHEMGDQRNCVCFR